MTPDEICNLWNSFYPEMPPLYIHTSVYRERWLRIYSLPEGKRYPTNSKERQIVLHRHNEVAKEMLGLDAQCYFFRNFNKYESPKKSRPSSLNLIHPHPIINWMGKFNLENMEKNLLEYLQYISFSAGQLKWKKSALDNLIMDIAKNRIHSFVFFSPANGRVYAPYDGGVDLILESIEVRNILFDKYEGWRSPREDGF